MSENQLLDTKIQKAIQLYNLQIFWISLARVFSSISFKVQISVSHLRGLPFPSIHSLKISKFICSALSRYCVTIASTSDPVLSSRSRTPNCLYPVLLVSGQLQTQTTRGNYISVTCRSVHKRGQYFQLAKN